MNIIEQCTNVIENTNISIDFDPTTDTTVHLETINDDTQLEFTVEYLTTTTGQSSQNPVYDTIEHTYSIQRIYDVNLIENDVNYMDLSDTEISVIETELYNKLT